jgi:3-hydroxyisobutyrate dehydrogenase-like beta-hydroxyacid dehydrogenase
MANAQAESLNRATIGLLYPGEMGSRLGGILVEQGYRVVTTLTGRSDRTWQQATRCAIERVESLDELARAASVVISVVPPGAAEDVASDYLTAARRCEASSVYVDANAISPVSVQRIGASYQAIGVDFVDASIHGLAATLPANGTMYLCGKHADQIAALFDTSLNVSILGPELGTASALKMLIGGLNKGVVSLFVELALLADTLGLLDQTLAIYEQSYPGVMEIVKRLLPTYPRHAKRRSEELQELSETIVAAGLIPNMVPGAAETMALFNQGAQRAAEIDGPSVKHQKQSIVDLVHDLSVSAATIKRSSTCPLPTRSEGSDNSYFSNGL